MERLALLAAALVVIAGVAVGQPRADHVRVHQTEPRLIGLVELPGLFGSADPEGPPGALLPGERLAVVVHEEPVEGSRLIGTVASADSVEWREAGYEAPAAVAFGVREGWVRIAVGAGGARRYGWVSPEQVGALRMHGDLVAEGLAYLTDTWDGVLRQVPSTTPAPAQADGAVPGALIDVDVLEVREVGGVTWLEVARLAPGRCGSDSTAVVATGWVPALAGSGLPNVWFHARGC